MIRCGLSELGVRIIISARTLAIGVEMLWYALLKLETRLHNVLRATLVQLTLVECELIPLI